MVTAVLFLATACTDAQKASSEHLGESALVRCFSGEKILYQGYSMGKIRSFDKTTRYRFTDAASQKLVEVNGNCLVVYGMQPEPQPTEESSDGRVAE